MLTNCNITDIIKLGIRIMWRSIINCAYIMDLVFDAVVIVVM